MSPTPVAAKIFHIVGYHRQAMNQCNSDVLLVDGVLVVGWHRPMQV